MSKKKTFADKSPRLPDDTQVALSSFVFFYAELCHRVNSVPTKVRSVDEVEQRLTDLGAKAGARLIMLASVRDPLSFPKRPITVEATLKLLQDKLWLQWFGKPASDLQRENGTDRFFIYDNDPFIAKYVQPSSDYIDSEGRWRINHASYMGGIVKGALGAIGFPADVVAYHQPEVSKPNMTLFVIDFAPQVWDRERRLKP